MNGDKIHKFHIVVDFFVVLFQMDVCVRARPFHDHDQKTVKFPRKKTVQFKIDTFQYDF